MKAYLKLTKFGIGLFVMISGLAGYAVSFPLGHQLDIWEPILLLAGLYLVSAGSFSINQAQEWRHDQKMPRTAARPVATGQISVGQAYTLGIFFCMVGIFSLLALSHLAAELALLTVVLYNGMYTLLWKKHWAFGAVPGAIPGALPVMIGYAANSTSIFSPDCIYLFLIMFLWQMPHFWALALRYKDDYAAGGFPVLPLKIGSERTLYHIGLYTFVYVGVALTAPWFITAHILFLLFIVPLALKVIFEFFKYYHSKEQKAWLPFFLWVNLSMLIFICVPVFDKWVFYFLDVA